MRTFLLGIVLTVSGLAQTTTGWVADTGSVSLSSAGTTATVQQPASNGAQIILDRIVVTCSVACVATEKMAGTAATTTAGTIVPLPPVQGNAPITMTFFTASNVGSGTTVAVHSIAASTPTTICLSQTCGNGVNVGLNPATGTSSNYSVSIGSITGTAQITFYGRSIQ